MIYLSEYSVILYGGSVVSNAMSTQLQVQQPDHFDFNQPEKFDEWKSRFELFVTLAKVGEGATNASKVKRDAFVYMLGPNAIDILNTFQLSDEDNAKYETVLAKFEDYFNSSRSVLADRWTFRERKQNPGESINDFIISLHSMARYLDFGASKNERIRDQLVFGVRDENLRNKLKMKENLTLTTAEKLCRQSVIMQGQQDSVNNPANRDFFRNNDFMFSPTQNRQAVLKEEVFRLSEAPTSSHACSTAYGCCNRERDHVTQPVYDDYISRVDNRIYTGRCCGRRHVNNEVCPATLGDRVCYKCGNKGHYARCCRTKVSRQQQLRQRRSNVSAIEGNKKLLSVNNGWFMEILVNDFPVLFKLDTGATVTVIPETLATEVNAEIISTDRTFLVANGANVKPVGKCHTKLTHNERSIGADLFVFPGSNSALLGLPEIMALNIIAPGCVNAVNPDAIANSYPDLFGTLGKIKGEKYKIELTPDVVPFALTNARPVPIPLLGKVKEELDRMQRLNVCSKVTQPTDWCSPIVVVSKPDGTIRLCGDYTHLNKYVKRENYPMQSTDYLLAQIGKSKIFSRLDLNSAFWQLELDEESKLLTTFITPFGRFYFHRCPFGITSIPERYQRSIAGLLSGLKGVISMMDDVFIHGENQIDHDIALKNVLDRLSTAGVTLKRSKCLFSVNQVKFLGHVITSDGIRADPDKTKAIDNLPAPSNVPKLRQFLGCANYLAKFLPHFSTISAPLRNL